MIPEDTICALATPPGKGALALIRLSGTKAISIIDRLAVFPNKEKKLRKAKANTLHYALLKKGQHIIDEVIISLFHAPNSYTGEDLVEISCHGSAYIQQKIIELLLSKGARMAKPGEFTLRAFLNGKLDLSQAEAVADLIASGSDAAHKLAIKQMRGGFSAEIKHLRDELLKFASLLELELDFSEEDVEFANRDELSQLLSNIKKLIDGLISTFEYGNAIKNGVPVAIMGPTNAGKSTLLNRLLREEKAIVSEIAGTTRDYIEDTIILEGIQFRFIDTAGLRPTADTIEMEGIHRSMKQFEKARIVLIMIEPGEPVEELKKSLSFLSEDAPHNLDKTTILIVNKTDLIDASRLKRLMGKYHDQLTQFQHIVPLSAKEGTGIDELEKLLVKESIMDDASTQETVVTNVRHFDALSKAREALSRASGGLQSGLTTDFIAQDIREVLHYLGEITGEVTTDEILGNIFKNFCIGK